jgi:intein/homing endonuclease
MVNELDIIDDFKNGFNISALESKYGGRRKTLRKILFKNNLIDSIEPVRKCYFNGGNKDDIKNKVLIKYKNEKNLKILSDEFKIPIMSIYNFLRKEDVFNSEYGKQLHHNKVRKYSLNEQYFDNIDCEEKAYFWGILYADGNNSIKKTEIKLNLQEDDHEILIKLNNLLQPTKPILYKPTNRINCKSQYALIINSKIISYRLNELGIVPNKTFKVEYPTWLNNDLNRHFIRGYFDGDGCVTFNKINKQLCISFTGTENMMLGIQRILMDQLDFYKTKLSNRYPERNNNIRSLMYFGNGNSRKFYNYLYNNSKIYMARKKNKFNKHLKLN